MQADETPDDAAVQAAAARILASLDFRYQEQLTLVRGGALPSGRLGLVELGAAASFWSVGVAGAVGFERVPDHDLHGGYGHIAAQWRPVALASDLLGGRRAFHWLDPHVALGARLGGLRGAEETLFRGAMTLGAGLDVGLAFTEVHPVITLRYQADVFTHPTREDEHGDTLGTDSLGTDSLGTDSLGTPEHFFLFGVGIRTAD